MERFIDFSKIPENIKRIKLDIGLSYNAPHSQIWFENNPENMLSHWKELSRGVFKLDKELMLVLDINNLVKF